MEFKKPLVRKKKLEENFAELVFDKHWQVTSVPEDYVLRQEAYILFYARQGTPWFSSLMQTQKPCLDPNTSGNSPKSVLDNVDSISTSVPNISSSYGHEASESVAVDEISVALPGGARGDGIQGHEDGSGNYRDDAPMPLGVSGHFDGTSGHMLDIFSDSPLRDNDINQHNSENYFSKIRPQTPPRSPSPDIYAEDPPGKKAFVFSTQDLPLLLCKLLCI